MVVWVQNSALVFDPMIMWLTGSCGLLQLPSVMREHHNISLAQEKMQTQNLKYMVPTESVSLSHHHKVKKL